MDDIQRQLHRQLQTGERLAIGWGVSGYVEYQLRFSPYPFQYLVDASGQLAGTQLNGVPVITMQQLASLDPTRYVVVVLAEWARFGQEICHQAQALGFVAIPPAVASELAPDFPEQNFHALFNRLSTEYPPEPRHSNVAALYIQNLVKGGAERQIVLLAQGLIELGYQVHLVCQSPDHPATLGWQQQLLEAGVQRHLFQNPRKLWVEQPPNSEELKVLGDFAPYLRVRGLHNILCMQRILRQLQPELFVSYLDDGNLSSAVAGIWSGQPRSLLSCRDVHQLYLGDQSREDFYICPKANLWHWTRYFQQSARLELYHNSQTGADSYRDWLKLPGTDFPVVANAIVPMPPEDTEELRRQYAVRSNELLLLGVMRFYPQKNPQAFLHLLASLRAKQLPARGILLGDGPLADELRCLQQQLGLDACLLMPGAVDNPAIFYQAADLFIQTSRHEGMPNAVLEAQVNGCPLIVTDAGGTRETLAPQLHRYLVPVADDAAMLNTVLKTLPALPEIRQDMQSVREFCLVRFSPQQLAEKTIRLNQHPPA
jgi:glycosyltransferase involved in cell wall biosynthesis